MNPYSLNRKEKFTLFLKNNLFPIVLTLIFLILSIVLIIHHEFWYDEINVWDRVVDSNNFTDLIKNISDSEGHPFLWYVILFFLSKITLNVEAIKIIHLGISTTAIFIFLKYFPYKKIISALFIFSYFLFYEYSIISRNYSLGVLFIFIFCALYKNKFKNIIFISITLLFLAQTNIYCVIISFILSIYFIIDLITNYKSNKSIIILKKNIIISILIILLGWVLISLQLGPQFFENTQGFSYNSIKLLDNASSLVPRGVISAFLPIPRINYLFWYTNVNFFTQHLIYHNLLYSIIPAIILIIIPIFFLKRKVIFIYVAGTSLMLLIPLFVFKGVLRHYGNIIILLIACLWLSKNEPDDKYLINNKLFKPIFYIFISIFLIVSIIGSSIAFYYEYKYPFTEGKEVAKYIEENFNKDDIIIVGFRCMDTNVVSAYLQKKFYYPELKQYGRFLYNSISEDISKSGEKIDIENAFKQARELFEKNNKDVLVITNKLLIENPDIPIKYGFSKIEKEFQKSIIDYDILQLYILRK